MTKANLLKLHTHLSFLASGKFNERHFDYEVSAEDPENSGSMRMGKMSSQRVDLIKSDALRHKQAMEEKHPFLVDPKAQEVVEPEEEPEPEKKA